MCGIIGAIGDVDATDIVIEGLTQMQNRGYDSAGISNIFHNEFITSKFATTCTNSAIHQIKADMGNHKLMSINAMGHTRWATHGAPTNINSHPHISMNKKISVIHNGIIENYNKIKDDLSNNHGYIFHSQTDSEVIPNMIEYFFECSKQHFSSTYEAMIDAINKTIRRMDGTWGLVIQCTECPNHIFCTRHGSPILVSDNTSFAIIASEQSGFCGKTKNYFALRNYDICSIAYSSSTRTVSVKTNEAYENKHVSDTSLSVLSPDPFSHWMIKEIHEQGESSMRAISLGGRIQTNNTVMLGGLAMSKPELMNIDHLILLGCGTSYFAGLLGMHYFKDICGFHTVHVIDGAEFCTQDIPTHGRTGCILLSQSGETKDLHRCIQIGKENNILLIGVINVVDSMIARECHCGCYLNAGREVGVASTKSFTSQLIVLSMIAIWFSQNRNIHESNRFQYISDIHNLHTDIGITIKQTETIIQSSNILERFMTHNSCFLLGKGRGEAIAKEGALKIKEISYIHAEGYSTSSLKHGPFSLLLPGFPVIIFAFGDKHYAKALNAYEEIKARSAFILFITDVKHTVVKNDEHTVVIVLPSNETYNELLGIIPIQLLAYYLSIKKEINPDMPRNLAKVVTVE